MFNMGFREKDNKLLAELFATRIIESNSEEYIEDVIDAYTNDDYDRLEKMIVKIVADNIEEIADETYEKLIEFLY